MTSGGTGSKVLLTGAAGMLGQAVRRAWSGAAARLDADLVPVGRDRADLMNQAETRAMVRDVAPDTVIHCAAKVGGIGANSQDRSGFLLTNLQIDINVIEAALAAGVTDLIYISSSCVYPRGHRQPLVEDDLMAGPLEPANDGYALAKLTATTACRLLSAERGVRYRALVASNLYGPGDATDLDHAHLVAAALQKAHRARLRGEDTVDVWGDGTARREFTFVDDLAEFVVDRVGSLDDLPAVLNVGAGSDHSVADYYRTACEVVGFEGSLTFDPSRPVGMRQRLMDSALAREHGWKPRTSLREGMSRTYTDLRRRLA